LLGNYNGFSGEMSTLLEGIVQAAEPGTIIEHNTGFLFNNDTMFHGFWQAKRADAVVVCIGINALFEGEENDALLNPHGGDRADVGLPANQVEYLRLMREAIGDKPLIAIVTGGSALAMPEVDELVDAILFAWYPGEAGGRAAAGILFGDINPSGRLPVTFYQSVDDLPDFDEYSMENRTYKYFKGEPLFAFGHGLSYTDFSYSEAKVEDQQLIINIENTGNHHGEEVVQVYVRQANSIYPKPFKELMGFKRISLEAGEKSELSILLDWNILNYWNPEEQDFDRDPGVYELLIGASSEDIRMVYEIKI
jgi:beta-glucosidase